MALAERLSGPLITCDTKLAATTGSRCSLEPIAASDAARTKAYEARCRLPASVNTLHRL
jgi:hypothetical protein